MQYLRPVLTKPAFYGTTNNAFQQMCHIKRNYGHDTSIHPWFGVAATNQTDGICHQKKYSPQFFQIVRSIYTNEHIKIDNFRSMCIRKNLKQGLGNKDELQTQLSESFSKYGIQNIFAEDLNNLIYAAENDCDLQQISDIIQAFLEDAYRLSAKEKIAVLSNFISQCKILNSVDIAKNIWKHKDVSIYKSKTMIKKYHMLLYDHEHYSEIIEDFERDSNLEDNNSNFKNATKSFKERDALIVFAALAKLGTEDALSKMTQIVNEERFVVTGRSRCLYSLLGLKLKKHGLAYDAISKNEPSFLRSNLKLAILIEVGRLDEAILLLRSELRPPYGAGSNPRWYRLSFHIIKKLTEAVKEKNNSELTKDLVMICQDLDSHGDITDSSLEDLVFEPIGKASLHPKFERSNKRDGVKSLS